MINLNRKFNYTLREKTFKPSNAQFRMIYDSKVDGTYWSKTLSKYVDYKNELKKEHYFGQTMRCAYCRAKLRADAYWEDLDHIVPQSIKGEWVFYPKNLITTCPPCNRLKNADNTLSNPMTTRFPLYSNGFTIFNPHFDSWSDHFQIVNGIFLKGVPGTKGPQTYHYCQLYRMDIILAYSDEQRIFSLFTMRRLTHRLKSVDIGSREEQSIRKAITHIIRMKKQN
mgnify:CR=1 FL=1|tara:strand:+ start:21218 stop:21892 length:675 start_codon:yes stop_codon:yes gene_type:complete